MTREAARALEAALRYASLHGWRVFPVNRDKSPATRHGFKDAMIDPSDLRALWAERSASGIGVRTGAESGIVVLDIDRGGRESLSALVETHSPLPATVEASTGGGGTHLYFKHRGNPVPNSAAKLGPGLDVRGDGGYVVAPPSPHPSGRSYAWMEGHSPEDIAVAEMPDWLADLLEAPKTSAAAAPTRSYPESIPEGRRNSTLTSLAGSLRRSGLSPAAIGSALLTTNEERCAPPLKDAEVERIAASADRWPAEAETDLVLEVISVRKLCHLPDPPTTDNLLGPLLGRGSRTVVAAHTGEGKTTFALQIVKAVVDGTECLEWIGSGGKALIVDAEQRIRTIKRQLREAGLACSDLVDYLQAPGGLSLDQDGPDASQIEAMLATGAYDLIVADPLYKLHRGDSNDERHAVDLMRRLDHWRINYGVALLLLTHRRKSQFGSKGFTMDDIFGSSAFLRGAEVVLGLRRSTPGYAHLHFFKDRDGDLPVGEKWGLLFDREQGFRRDPEDGKAKETAKDKIQAALETDPTGLTTTQLQQVADCSDKTARKAVNDLGADSTTGKNGEKTWRLPDDNGRAGD